MKKKLLVLILAITMIVVAACSSSKSPTSPGETDKGSVTTSEDKPVIDKTIKREVRVVGHLFDDTRRQILANVAEKLKKEWPNITLVDDCVSDHGTKLKLELPTGSGPEIFSVDDLYQQQLLPYISDITDIVIEHKFAERSLEGALDFNNQRTPGHYYSVPFTMSPCAFYYNKAIFKELNITPPKTFDELEAILAKIKNESNYIPLANAGLSNRHVLWMTYCNVSNNADMNDIRKWYFQESTPESVKNAFIKSFEILQDWCNKGYFGDVKTVLGIDHLVYISNVYGKGNVAMSYDGDWRLQEFEASGIDTGVFAFPSEYGTNAVDFSWALNKEAGEDPTMRAFFADFVEAFFDRDIVAQFYEAGYTPSIKIDTTGLTVSPLRQEFMEAIKNQKVGYFLDNAAPGMFEALTKITQQLMLNEITPEEAWVQMDASYEQGKASVQSR
ncbi:MAG TPA: extracellular solute-binding protein [Clostridiaceae bacterium]|nr:extracellular solute-binding protein [Clostridiaceae bacterium]